MENRMSFAQVFFIIVMVLGAAFTAAYLTIQYTGLQPQPNQYILQGTMEPYTIPGPVEPVVQAPPTQNNVVVIQGPTQSNPQPIVPMLMVDEPTMTTQPTLPPYTTLKTCKTTTMYKQPLATAENFVAGVPAGIPLQVVARTPDLKWVKLLQETDNLELFVPAEAFCFSN